jgi:ribosomal protein S26
MAKKQTTQKMPRGFDLRKAIRGERIYKSNVIKRDRAARKFFENNQINANTAHLKIGSLYLMEYFYPKTEDQLEYYDAMPCSIFFGRVKTKKGEPRVLAFNLHYYPPRIRFQVLARVMEIFKPFYQKMWASDSPSDISYFNYKMLVYQLQKAKLDFGVRMYIPKLIGDCLLVEPQHWQKAVFTEGRFHKRTRQAIMNYWKQRKIDGALNRRSASQGAPPKP